MISLSDVKSVLDVVIATAKKLKNQELNSQIINLQELVMDLHSEYMQEREIRLRAEKRLKDIESSEGLMLGADSYWDYDADANLDGPFCTNCYDSEGKRVRLNKMPRTFREFGTHVCPSCDSKVNARPPNYLKE